jgi:hypothetical protein
MTMRTRKTKRTTTDAFVPHLDRLSAVVHGHVEVVGFDAGSGD